MLNMNELWLNATATDDAAAAADGEVFTIPQKCSVIEAGVVVEGTENTTATIKFDKRILAGSDTGRGNGDVGIIVLPASNVAGKVYYDVAEAGDILEAGDQVVVEVTTASSGAKVFRPYLRLRPMDETNANQSDKVETA